MILSKGHLYHKVDLFLILEKTIFRATVVRNKEVGKIPTTLSGELYLTTIVVLGKGLGPRSIQQMCPKKTQLGTKLKVAFVKPISMSKILEAGKGKRVFSARSKDSLRAFLCKIFLFVKVHIIALLIFHMLIFLRGTL